MLSQSDPYTVVSVHTPVHQDPVKPSYLQLIKIKERPGEERSLRNSLFDVTTMDGPAMAMCTPCNDNAADDGSGQLLMVANNRIRDQCKCVYSDAFQLGWLHKAKVYLMTTKGEWMIFSNETLEPKSLDPIEVTKVEQSDFTVCRLDDGRLMQLATGLWHVLLYFVLIIALMAGALALFVAYQKRKSKTKSSGKPLAGRKVNVTYSTLGCAVGGLKNTYSNVVNNRLPWNPFPRKKDNQKIPAPPSSMPMPKSTATGITGKTGTESSLSSTTNTELSQATTLAMGTTRSIKSVQ